MEFQGKGQTVHRLWNMKWRVSRKLQSVKQSEKRCLDRNVGGESGRREGQCRKELYTGREFGLSGVDIREMNHKVSVCAGVGWGWKGSSHSPSDVCWR